MSEIEKKLKRLEKSIDDYGEKYMNKIAYKIASKAQVNFDRKRGYITGTPAETIVDVYYHIKSQTEAEVIASGLKVAFIEFGTGVHNSSYTAGFSSDYIWDTHPALIVHGSYGKHRGHGVAWGFYARDIGSIQLAGRDFINTKQHSLPVITFGIEPTRSLYSAVRDTKREIKKK